MKKSILLISLFALIFSACVDKQNPEYIKGQIKKHKEKVEELNLIIDSLQAVLDNQIDSISNESGLLVEVKTIGYEPFEHYFEATGTVEAVQDAVISPEMSGKITKIYVEEGDKVYKGQLMASLNSTVLSNSVAELETSLELAEVLYEKQKYLWDQNIGTELQYLEAKSTKESLEASLATLKSQLALTRVYAPFAGIVDEIYQKQGELGVPGVPMMQLVNLDEMYVNADISETYLSSISSGDTVKIEFPSYPDISFNTVIFQKGNIVEAANRTFKITLKFDNIEDQIKPNLLAVLTINDYSLDSALLVPTTIVKQDISGSYLFVVDENDSYKKAKKVYVETGRSDNENTVIISGIGIGEKVITGGYALVKDGSRIVF